MTIPQLVSVIVLSVIIPFALQLVKTKAISSEASRWVALAASAIGGVVTGFVGGVPADPAGWATCIFAVIGGVQTAYTAFKEIGITNKWLDALLAVGVTGKPEDK